jgi:hypothetical protein
MIELSNISFLIILGLLAVLAGVLFYKLMARPNELIWEDLVATNGRLNAYKCGYLVGLVISSWAVIKTTYMGDLDAGVFGVYLAFLGGVPVAAGAIGSRKDSRRRDVDDPDR